VLCAIRSGFSSSGLYRFPDFRCLLLAALVTPHRRQIPDFVLYPVRSDRI